MSQESGHKRRWWIYLGGGTLWISILIHVFFGAIAAYIVVEHFSKKHVSFVATAPPAPSDEVEHKVELANRNNLESAPPDLKRITTSDLSPISLPDVPQTPVTDEATPTTLAGTGDIGEGFGGGNGNGGGDGGGIPPAFGSSDGRGLEGYFYDLKQTQNRKPTGVKLKEFYEILKLYLDHGWDDEDLKKYFKSDRPLYTTRFAISTRKSVEAPKAFNLEKEVKPALWAIHYTGKVLAPEGDYRFVGFADNIIIVRIGGVVVFDGGYTTVVTQDDLHVNYPFAWSPHYSSEGLKASRGLLKKGVTFHMESNQPVDMDVLIGDDGGDCAFYLMVMREGNAYDSLPDGTPEAPFFQLDSKGPQHFLPTEEHPPFSSTVEPWQTPEN